MSRAIQSLSVITSVFLGFVAVSLAQAGDVFKGSVTGAATFVNGQNPMDGFATQNAVGTLTHLGKTVTVLAMSPNTSADGTVARGFSGGATLTAANRDELDMSIVTDDPVVTKGDGTATAVFHGKYQMHGGTGRFADASLSADITITIKCDLRKLAWTITIEW